MSPSDAGDAQRAWSVPPELADLLERPLVGFLATRRPDGTLQNNPMWFWFDGSVIEMSHTSDRQKFRNLMSDPSVSLCIPDPENPYRYVEVRGDLVDVRPDEGAAFHRSLRERYGMDTSSVPDAAVRVVLTVRPTTVRGRAMQNPTTRS